MKSFIAALAALALATPANADPREFTPSELLNRGVHPAIVEGFTALGVPVVDGSGYGICGDGKTSRTMALYNYVYNVVIVCQDHIQHGDEFIKSVTHEAVHMVQDCRSGLTSGSLDELDPEQLDRLMRGLHPRLQRVITKLYDQESWPVEIEAFYFQSRPAAVAEGIARFCF